MPKAKYEEIYRSLKEKLEQGEYPRGALLPSENSLVGVYGCSRNTVRRALAGLIRDGYVQAVHGKGVQAIWQKPARTTFTVGGIETFQEAAARNNLHSITRVVVFAATEASEALAAQSGFAPGAPLWQIERIRVLNGQALIRDINYLRRDLMPQLTAAIAERSIYAYLEQQLGMQIVTSRRTITVEQATSQDRARLDLAGYDCLAVITGQTYNANGEMFEYTCSRHHPACFSFQATVTRRK